MIDNVIETAFRAFIVAQPFLWMWMFEDDRFDFLNEGNVEFWAGLAIFAWIVYLLAFKVSIGFYSTELLIVYSILVYWGTCILQGAFYYRFKDALATSFLITYLNSWYWEGVLHVWAIQENGFNTNQLVQLLHLIPAVYFLIRWEFDVHESAKQLMTGWAFAGVITFTRKARLWKYLPIVWTDLGIYQINHGLMIANRFICFYYLTKAIVRWGMPKKPLELRERGLPRIEHDYSF